MFQNPTSSTMEQQQQNINYNGIQQQQLNLEQKNVRKKAYVKIIEQPAGKALRFRYECEGRSAGSIPGVNSTPEIKTYPTIEIVGYKGRAVVVVSCVTKDMPYRPHPHNLVGKEGCKKGVCTVEIKCETMRAVFSNLGIQCVKKKDIEEALKAREEMRVDPFKTGFSHRSQPSSIDLNSVRLCFQVFVESEHKGRFTQPLPPVVSEPIYDKKAMSNLVICSLCSCSASVLGNTQIMLQCEKVSREDIAVRFFEEKNSQQVWEAYGEFQHTDVHKQFSIKFKTPRYHTLDISEPAKVFIQLLRPSDGMTSESLPFEYKPLDSDPAHLRRKRQKTGGDPMHLLLQQLQHQNKQDGTAQNNANCWNTPNIPPIKTELRGKQPLSPSYANITTPSPYNDQILSPEHHQQQKQQQYFGGPGTENAAITADNMKMPNFNPFTQQNLANHVTQQQQHQHQQHNYHTNHFATHWGNKISAAAMSAANNNNNIIHLNNPLATNNHLTTSDGSGVGSGVGSGAGVDRGTGNGINGSGAAAGGSVNQHWNISTNHVSSAPHQHQHPHTHQQQQQHALPPIEQQPEYTAVATELPELTTPNGLTNGNVHVNDNNNNNENGNLNNNNNNRNKENGPTVSNLLNFNSEQLVHINSEDQQMLSLNTEDLKISDLSIT